MKSILDKYKVASMNDIKTGTHCWNFAPYVNKIKDIIYGRDFDDNLTLNPVYSIFVKGDNISDVKESVRNNELILILK